MLLEHSANKSWSPSSELPNLDSQREVRLGIVLLERICTHICTRASRTCSDVRFMSLIVNSYKFFVFCAILSRTDASISIFAWNSDNLSCYKPPSSVSSEIASLVSSNNSFIVSSSHSSRSILTLVTECGPSLRLINFWNDWEQNPILPLKSSLPFSSTVPDKAKLSSVASGKDATEQKLS